MDMKRFRDSLSAGSIVLGISGIVSFLVFLILYGVTALLAGSQTSQQMAERWSEKKDVSQISCFFSPNAYVDSDSIEMFRHSLDGALQQASIVQDSPNANARLWADAYSADGRITVSGERGSVTADAIGVGGDFFLFHPLQLLNGSYFSESDYNQDYCILDEEAAWQLFGSNDINGQIVMIGNIPHMVAGVVHREEGKLEQAAGLDSTVIYVSYTTLSTLGSSNGINHYEIVMPNPVDAYAYNYVKENIGVAEKELEVVENTTRYELMERLQVIADFGTRSMNGKAIIYPYWENVARGYEDIIAALTLLGLVFLIYPVMLFVIFVVIWWKHKTWTARSIYLYLQDKGERKMEDVRAKRLRKKQHKDRFDDEEELL